METSDPKYKHKPSEKHTLEEVLKSLQDLIRNDLDEGASGAAKPGPAPATSQPREGAPSGTANAKPRRDNTSNLREDFAPVAPGSGPVNLDAVMRSLKDLIGNELNVGDATPPAPTETAPASTHAEYLATEEKIEEYVPEELGQPDDLPDLGDESAPPESGIDASPQAEPLMPDEIIEETLPQGFTPLDEELTLEELAETVPPAPDLTDEIAIEATPPEEFVSLDEELTFEEPAEMAPPAPVVSEMPELPGEISPELAFESELQPPPAPEIPPAVNTGIAPGTQQELFLDEPPPIELRMPPPAAHTTPAAEPVPEPETAATPVTSAPEIKLDEGNTEQALPTIEVEETFEAGNYFDAAQPPAENAPAAPEELITLDMEISSAPETTPAAIEPPPSTPTVTAPVPESPAAPVEKKITLEVVSGPLLDDPQSRTSVDFDAYSLEPPPPELSPPPAAAEIPAPEAELPVIAIEPDLSPAPETEKAPDAAPVPEIKTETISVGEPPATPAEPPATTPPPALTLDDIPVLNEVVAPPARSVPTHATPPAPPLPAPDRARDLVVRAVAKLNVEMRKSGGAGLDTKTILRLQQLIRQELEKGGEK